MLNENYRLDIVDGWSISTAPESPGCPEPREASVKEKPGCTLPDYWTRHSVRHESPQSVWLGNTFESPESIDDPVLYVPGADNDATFFLNGREIGRSTGYSEDNSFDLSNAISSGQNNIAIRLTRTSGTEEVYGPVSVVSRSRLSGLTQSKISLQHAKSSPAWVENSVIYEVYPRSFSKNESFRSIIEAIPDLKSMGVTVIWLMPIHPIGELNRKGPLGSPYSIKDYYAINPEYGTLDDFKALVKAVHNSGLHIIIDLVINHTSWDNPLITQHPDWYKHDSAGKIIAPNPDWTDVAQLDYSNPALRDYMIKMMKYWVNDIGIDGFRCDVAEMVPLDFWESARAALDSIKPVMMLAEGSRPAMHLKAFDLTYAWNIYDVLGKIFEGTTPATTIDSVLNRESREFPVGSLRLRFNTNHDKNASDGASIERYGPAGDSLTAALITTLPGVPLIYNGDEVGNPKKLSLFEQVPIDWNAKNGYRKFHQEILKIRRDHPELVRGSYGSLTTNDPKNVYAFERVDGKNISVCVFNFSSRSESSIEITFSDQPPGRLRDAVNGRTQVVSGKKLTLSLEPYGFTILDSH